MNCLAVDTGGSHLTVLLIKGGEVHSRFLKDASLKHSVTLLTEIENLLTSLNTPLNEIDVFCSVVGPGSFTGIRIGVSTIKALAYSQNKKILSVTSFTPLAYNSDNERVLAVINANHDNFYACGFVNKKVELPPRFITKEEVINLSKEYQIVSDVSLDIPHVKADLLKGFEKAVVNSLDLATFDRESLIPLYVKKSQAEEERNGK